MRLILARHGNTFEQGQAPFMVGARYDLELTKRGSEQAEEIASALEASGISIKAVYSSPLKRTLQSSKIISEKLRLDPSSVLQDSRLRELDYGKWEGLTSSEIASRFGEAEIKAWENHSIWPNNAEFMPYESDVREMIVSFVRDIERKFEGKDAVLVVSSNGKLRYFLDLVPGEFATRSKNGSFKMGTGHLSMLTKLEGVWGLDWWNVSPSKIAPASFA